MPAFALSAWRYSLAGVSNQCGVFSIRAFELLHDSKRVSTGQIEVYVVLAQICVLSCLLPTLTINK